MKHLYIILLTLLIIPLLMFVGCGEKVQRYHIDEITSPSNTLTYLKKDMSLVNGIVFCEFGDMGLFKEGKEDGVLKGWYEGHLIYEYNYKEGKEDGLCKMWYKNGQLQQECNYKEGKEDGILKHYYENGQLMWECNYKDGEKISEKCWNKNGVKTPC